MPIIAVSPLPGPAILAIARPRHGGRVVVLVDANEPWRRIVPIIRMLLPRHERREVYRALLTHYRVFHKPVTNGGAAHGAEMGHADRRDPAHPCPCP
jgi:hypothetical protein